MTDRERLNEAGRKLREAVDLGEVRMTERDA